MKRIFFTLLLATLFLHAEVKEHVRLPYKTALSLLQKIQKNAIILGSGKTQVHVFVDPLCPHSRKFITMISRNETMLAKYKYYIYLYSIPRLHSEETVAAIYASKTPNESLLQVMVDDRPIPFRTNERVPTTVEDIAGVARKMDVYKRPYLFVEDKE